VTSSGLLALQGESLYPGKNDDHHQFSDSVDTAWRLRGWMSIVQEMGEGLMAPALANIRGPTDEILGERH
jgi:hypothetical protein